MTDLDVYREPEAGQYQARLAMTPDAAKALDDQLRLCTQAVLRPGTDYGTIPGAGDRQILFKAGAEKLLQWFGYGFTCDRVDTDIDADGQRQGVTYRCTITKRLNGGGVIGVATCEGYAGYDELKFYKPVTEAARHAAEARERGWAAKDRRPANPGKWQQLEEYRAPWNTVIKMAQKRAIVGATIDATAAAGLFTDEEDTTPPPADGAPPFFETALDQAATLTDVEDLKELWTAAAQAARDGLCTPKQATHIQNRIKARQKQLADVTVVDVQDLAGGDDGD